MIYNANRNTKTQVTLYILQRTFTLELNKRDSKEKRLRARSTIKKKNQTNGVLERLYVETII